jgi:hypothetical protein
VFLLANAVGTAATTLEPYGDSPRAFYAVLADVCLILGVACLAFVAFDLNRVARWRKFVDRWATALYVLAAVAVGVPLVTSATNSLQASSIGEGGPSRLVLMLGGVGLAAGLAALMARRIALGLAVAAVLAVSLVAVAIVGAR